MAGGAPAVSEASGAARVVVGLALKKEKRKKHISDKLVQMAAEAGITLKFIDKEVPLEQQGPFVAILQKVRKPEWEQMLVEYAERHPEVKVFDLPAATYPLRDRGSMVSFLDGGGWAFEEPPHLFQPGRPPQRCRCNVPTNTTLAAGTSYSEAVEQLAATGLQYPLLAKPLWADGREGSHALAVVHTARGLQRLLAGEAAYLQLPVLLQQYVDHGGCLFKVYVLGDTSVRVKRSSLHLPQWHCSTVCLAPDAEQQQQQQGMGALEQQQQQPDEQRQPQTLLPTSEPPPPPQQQAAAAVCVPVMGEGELPDLELMERVSAYPRSKSWGKADTAPKGHGVPSPPAWLLQALAQRLRRKTGLNLFNFDVIVPMHLHRRQQIPQQQPPPPQQQPAAAAGEGCCAAVGQNGSAAAIGGGAGGSGGDLGMAGAVREDSLMAAEPEAADPDVVDLGTVAAAPDAAAVAAASAAAASAAAAAAPAAEQAEEQQQAMSAEPSRQWSSGGGEQQQELLYHLIDINYFPGYEKMPDYEGYMVQFLRSICFPQPDQQAAQQQQQAPPQ